ncbi:MAG: single-stranded-DNA-specific exonuclease RecJ [Gemmatimonadales bacterium]|nr:MAG: single-stranded-DNA-specific exonuclease RecJ [Gemmatimonadales bacterium]
MTRTTVSLPPPPDPVWEAGEAPADEAVRRLAAELSLPAALCGVLVGRGMADPGSVRAFLRPRLEHLHPPAALPDADVAVDRILQAIDGGETILVHGDYDVDGVCAAALLTRWIRRLGGRAVPFVPHRTEHGYDLGPAGVAAATAAGATLLLTCDSGIVAHAAVGEAAAKGIDVIVTDHHLPGPTLPAALAVVNPLRSDSTYPESTLCGTGVAYKLAELLAERRGIDKADLYPLLALVALATVADLVPLEGENRVLVRYGLRYLAHTKDPGLRALMEVAGVRGEVDAGQVGFVLGPRINAIGRMGAADTALRLLLAEDRNQALPLARELDAANRVRQEEDRRTLAEALDLLTRTFDPERDFGVVLAGEGWHPGVIGIVASRIVERIHRPVVLIALDGEKGRGSARSIPGVHLHQALEGCAHHLGRFGGHRQAAGMDVAASAIDAFRESFNARVRDQLSSRPPVPRLGCGTPVSLADADDNLHRLLEYMAPFGIGNPRPVFQVRGVEIEGAPREVGDGHLKLTLSDGKGQLEAIGFGLARRRDPVGLRGTRVDALFQLRTHEYRGRVSLQARLLDLRPAMGNATQPVPSSVERDQVA